MMKKTSIKHLPEDLMVEILSRVPAVYLGRSRSTSKGWNALIKDGKFVKKHSANAPRQSVVIMLIGFRVYLARFYIHGLEENVIKVTSQFSLKDPISNPSKEVYIVDIFHCDGLLLCTTKDNRLVVWNPCSGETRWMIKPKNSYSNFGYYSLGKSSCNKYKILRVDQHGNGYISPCLVEYEIYDFTSNSWRSVGKTRDWSIPRIKMRGVSVNGDTYWLAHSFSGDSPMKKDMLLCFDFSTERFERESLPVDHFSYHPMALPMTREEQKLCLLALRDCNLPVPHIDLWIATKIESTGVMSWRKFLTVERADPWEFLTFNIGMSYLADQEYKVLVCPGKHGNSNRFLHIVGDDKYVQVDHHDAGSKCSLLLSYVPTLVHIQ
ncbi:hypothetical protein EUTSA_v10022270mg [Eutrema salsugineum]|uniref:F-box domain-containing protein n=1 Tax=Eutrema salsugineum TaxID=72664 RepID=V4M635_EUTSA|nr:putative F-box protein At4g10190 [Eutrema salsugineum]ESQ47768.1 hypothetical protein EUTSA_v10022270mg [Eutrema salsugineum]